MELVLDGCVVDCKLFFSAYFVIPYCRVGFVQFFFGVSILMHFLCLFGIGAFYVRVTVHRNKFRADPARKLSTNLYDINHC
jgi:hypothetical protein